MGGVGHEVTLAAGATFTGNFVLPAKVGDGWIVFRSDDPGLPAEHTRVGLDDAAHMPTLVTPSDLPHWSVKNLFELKVGRRVLIFGDTFEQVWVGAPDAGQRPDAASIISGPGHRSRRRCRLRTGRFSGGARRLRRYLRR